MTLSEYQLLEQTKALYRGLPGVMFGTFTVTLLALFLLWSEFDRTWLLIWYASSLTVSLLRWRSWSHYQKSELTIENSRAWIRKMVFWTFMSGLHVGLMLLLFTSPDHLYHLIIVTGIYGGFIGSAVASIALYYPAYLLFATPPTVLFLIKSVFMGNIILSQTGTGVFTYTAAGFILVFFGVLTAIARNTQFSFNRMSALAYENKRLANEVIKQKETAENAVLAKTQFLAAASHDLRQPMHALGLYVGAFDHEKLDDDSNRIVSKIQLSTDALNDLLNSLLDISKLDANSVDNIPQDLNVEPMLETIVGQYLSKANANSTNITLRSSAGMRVHCDRTLLTRVIRNLVDNAVKFTHNGHIELVAKQKQHSIILAIKDTGLGIAAREQENIFTEFTQLDNPERDRQRGLGLGLAIVRRLCELMSVKIELDSQLGEGSCFTLTLPLAKGTEELTVESLPVTQLKLLNEIIVVIDDETEIREGTRRMVERWRATVVDAENADEAITKLDKLGLEPSLILSDLRLRENQNGIDAINKIREEFNSDIAAILITGDTSPEQIELADASNIPVLNKPVGPAVLHDEIQSVLQG